MTLRRRLSFQISLTLAGVAMLGIAGVVGVSMLHTDLGVSLRANEQLRHIYTVGVRVAAARAMIEQSATSRGPAADEMSRAADLFDTYGQSPEAAWIDGTQAAAGDARVALRRAITDLRERPTMGNERTIDTAAAFAAPYGRFADLIAATRQAVARRQALADQKQRWTLITLTTLAVTVMAGAIVVATRQYGSVIRPLAEVRGSVRRIASGCFDERVAIHGDEEFVALSTDFNRMTADLQALYADLEERIDIKSRELAQAERLASVGFLAAGVAHEINNPLGIIAGHSERSLMRLARGDGTHNVTSIRDSLHIICDEAFRCKRITDGLLALARPGDEARGPVRLDRLALEVIGTLSALPRFVTRDAFVRADPSCDWTVLGNEVRLRQVVLNLAVNALEATAPSGGRIHIELQKRGPTIAMQVVDNGKGMPATVLSRIFQPFYTEKRGGPSDGAANRTGTGLGLYIAQSIIHSLGGSIVAHSDGPECGSTFTVSLPSAAASAGKGHTGS
jgi:two-component system, NtrC family, sensor kinase